MNKIIENTEITAADVASWRHQGTLDEVPLMVAKHNAKVARLIEELEFIRDVDNDPDVKIAALVSILLRGIEFKESH